MLRSLKIENFRCFRSFELQQLGRLNLLVGTNNCGKTSVLEAIQLLVSQSNLRRLATTMIARGEYVLDDDSLDIRNLFHGHEIFIGNKLSISGENDSGTNSISVSVEEAGDKHSSLDVSGRIAFRRGNKSSSIPLSLKGYVRALRLNNEDFVDLGIKTRFLTSSSLDSKQMMDLFEQIVLTPEEELVIEALKIVEKNIERIAPGSFREGYSGSRSGFAVRLSNSDQRIPIGSMGDGAWRMLGLALALVDAKDGFLLVDEIDTGFHFSTMSTMWKLIWETAKKLNIQVFATTHNSDCWTSLAAIANTESPSEEGITIQRIEKDKPHSVVFNERQVVIAAERGIEVR
jgi:predicted ATP-dependent endonuclease of OLD family